YYCNINNLNNTRERMKSRLLYRYFGDTIDPRASSNIDTSGKRVCGRPVDHQQGYSLSPCASCVRTCMRACMRAY
ncbi:hypothetical protein ALC60_07520, partial [Trachymyrmex zeteki]